MTIVMETMASSHRSFGRLPSIRFLKIVRFMLRWLNVAPMRPETTPIIRKITSSQTRYE